MIELYIIRSLPHVVQVNMADTSLQFDNVIIHKVNDTNMFLIRRTKESASGDIECSCYNV